MITFELFGALDRCSNFSQKRVDMARISRVYADFYYDVDFYRDIQALARRKGRLDIVRAIDIGLKRSAWLSKGLRILRSIQARPLGRWWARRLERALLARHLT